MPLSSKLEVLHKGHDALGGGRNVQHPAIPGERDDELDRVGMLFGRLQPSLAIETMTDDTALILIHALDGRKTVKAAAQARAAALETSNEAVPGSEEGQGQGDT